MNNSHKTYVVLALEKMRLYRLVRLDVSPGTFPLWKPISFPYLFICKHSFLLKLFHVSQIELFSIFDYSAILMSEIFINQKYTIPY
jgi:hypothetical protein